VTVARAAEEAVAVASSTATATTREEALQAQEEGGQLVSQPHL